MAVAFIVGETIDQTVFRRDTDAIRELDLHRLGYPAPDPKDAVGQPDANYVRVHLSSIQRSR